MSRPIPAASMAPHSLFDTLSSLPFESPLLP